MKNGKKKSDSNENNMQQRSAQRGETRHLSIPKTTKYLVNSQKLLIEKKNAHKLLPTKLQNIRSDSNKNIPVLTLMLTYWHGKVQEILQFC